jgi:Protein of unknown function (DUF4058)
MVRSLKNQYLGINAHLHSFWQAVGGWNNFHNRHIGDLAGLLRLQLLPMGYTAVIEESLQVRRVDNSTSRPRSDILLGDREKSDPYSVQSGTAFQAELTVAELVAEVDEEKPYRALAIYEHANDDPIHGDPVGWIELLSPTNKGSGEDANAYLNKRRDLLESGLVFVEIDYLHETSSTFLLLKDYPAHQQGAHPYRIVVLDPRPNFRSGPAQPSEFDVDQPIPTVQIPLNRGDVLSFDFGAAYRKTFEEMAYGLEYINYRELPMNFERYSADDQARIAARMVAVLEAAKNGVDLETGPFPAVPMGLEAARARLKELGS